MTDIEADLMIANAEIKQLQARLEATISGQETLQKALATSQRREVAAVEDMQEAVREYGACYGCLHYDHDGSNCTHAEYKRTCGITEASSRWQWRGPQDEDAEEQGRLVRVPCKIGDTVWAIRSYHGILHPQQGVVSEMYFCLDMTLQIVVKHVTRGELGRTIFLTREEAEAALQKKKGTE